MTEEAPEVPVAAEDVTEPPNTEGQGDDSPRRPPPAPDWLVEIEQNGDPMVAAGLRWLYDRMGG